MWFGMRALYARPSLRHKHNLADMLARFHETMSFGRLGERKCAVDLRFDLAVFKEGPDPRLERARNLGFLGDRARPQRRAGQGQPLEHDRQEIDLDLRTFQESDLDDTPIPAGGGEVSRKIV